MARGGSRSGTPGKAYGNRADLNGAKPLAVTAAPGQTYGVAGAQRAAQAAVPMASGPSSPTSSATAPPSPPGPRPGSFGDLGRPSERPDEPVTSGAPFGAGPGAEALGIGTPLQSDPLVAGAAALNSLGNSADPDVRRLRDLVNASVGNQGAAS